MNDLPKVTVVIPLYNRANFIAQTVQSVLDQTYPNIELIIVDDGSTDNSLEVLKQFTGKIKLLEHPGSVNKGQSAAINLGVRSSDSKYMAILDSDDLFAPNKIHLQVEYLEKNNRIGLVYSNGQAVDANGNFLYYMFDENHSAPDGPECVLLFSHYNVPSNALIKKDVLDQAGEFDETMRSAQDHDMAVRLAEISSIGYISEALWVYRRHELSQSGMYLERRWKTAFKILEKANSRYPYSRKVIRKRRAIIHFRLGQCFLREKNFLVAGMHFCFAGLLDPVRSFKVCCCIDRP